jgi:hypothetical protein
MIFLFRSFPVILGVIMSFGATMPLALVQHETAVAQQRRKQPTAPRSRGVPGNRTASISRSCGTSSEANRKLIAFAPHFTQKGTNQIPEESVWGTTTLEHPSFWFFIPYTDSTTKLEFSLQNQQEEDIYRTAISVPQKSGVIAVRIPTSQAALQVNQSYRWTLKARVFCGSSTPDRLYVDGWVTRVKLPGGTQTNNGDIDAWYDAVTNLAEQRLQKPNDAQLKQAWVELLQSADLGSLAEQPLLK